MRGELLKLGGGYRRFDPPVGLKGPATVLRGTSSILDHHRRQRSTSRDPAWSEARYSSFNSPALRRDALPHRRDRRGIERIEMVATEHGLESRGRHAASLRLQLPRRPLPPGGTSNPMPGGERTMRIGGATRQRTWTSGTLVGLSPSLSTVKQDNLVYSSGTAPVQLRCISRWSMSETGSLQYQSAQGRPICHRYWLDANNALVIVAVPVGALLQIRVGATILRGSILEDDLPRGAFA